MRRTPRISPVGQPSPRKGGKRRKRQKRREHLTLRQGEETRGLKNYEWNCSILLAHIHIVYTLSFISLKAASAAPQAPPTLSSKKQQSSSISSSSQSELDSFGFPAYLAENNQIFKHYMPFCSSSCCLFVFSINLFAEKPEPVAEPPKPSQKKKVRRETWGRAAGPHEAYANDCWLCHMQ